MSELPRIELTAVVDGQAVARETFAGPDLDFTIGRADGADFRVVSHGVSRKHCKISLKDGGIVLEDLGSANGTFVAGHRVSRRVLVGTGEFSACSCLIRYSIELEESSGPSQLERNSHHRLGDLTMQITPANLRKGKTRRKVVRPALRGHLVSRGEAGAPERVILLNKATFSLGRGEAADHPLKSGPRVAALILRADALFQVLDVSPKADAVKINGEPRASAPIHDEDELLICGSTFLFRDGFPRLDSPPTKRWVRGEI